MRFSVSSENVEINELTHNHIERCIYFAMGRFAPAIDQISVRVADINGPRGGIDKRCQIVVNLLATGSKPIVVTDTAETLSAAISHASDRAGRTVARAVERRRHKKTRLHRRMQVKHAS